MPNNRFSLDWQPSAAGEYDARVESINVYPRELTFLRIVYQTESIPSLRLTEFVTVAAEVDNADTAKGKSRLRQLIAAAEVDVASITSLSEIAKRLIGARVRLLVGHKDMDGLPVPIVQAVLGKASDADADADTDADTDD